MMIKRVPIKNAQVISNLIVSSSLSLSLSLSVSFALFNEAFAHLSIPRSLLPRVVFTLRVTSLQEQVKIVTSASR